MLTLTCCQDHFLTENIWFVCSETSYSGYKRRCYYAGRTNKQLKIELLSQWKLSFAISFEGSPKGGLAVNYPPSLIETRKEPLTTVLLSHPFTWRETNHPVGEFCRWCRVIYCPDFHCSSPPRPIYCLNYHSGPRIIYSTVPDNAVREFLIRKVSRKTRLKRDPKMR